MEFDVLGPLRVRAGDQPVPVTAAMPRTLLGILLARANTPVPVDVLVDALWGGQRVESAHKKVVLHVHRLRRALGDRARIRHEHSGYTLRVDPGELDADRFENLLAEGADAAEPARAVQLLRSALALWRGEPFVDLGDVLLLRTTADRLTERRLIGLEDLYAAELTIGRAAAIVPELAELAAREPLRERLQALLMTALYRAGRQTEALAVFRRTRAALVDELGLEPGAELQRIEQSILAGDPAPEAATRPTITAPAQLPADITDFVGRDNQLTAVRHHLAAGTTTPAGTVAVAAIAGKAGVGKTTLAVHIAHQVREHFPDGQLYVNLRGAEARPLDATEVLARFLRALGVDGTAVPEDTEERAALYRSRLADRRMLIVLDDAGGENQVRPLLPGTPGCTVLITSRGRLAGLEGARLVDLDILDRRQAVELLARAAGPARVAAEPVGAGRIVRLCGRLPLAVRVAGARLAARPHWRLARLAAELDDEHRRLDKLRLGDLEVRASFALSYDSLDEPARCAFRRLGLLDAADFPAWTTAALLDVAQSRAEDLVDTLVDAQLLDVAGRDGAGQLRYRFHDLFRAYAREVAAAEESASDRLAALQRTFGGWLTLAGHGGCCMASTAFGVTVESVSCWQPDDAIIGRVLADPPGWFLAEWTALMGAVEQAHSIGADRLAGALGVRLVPFFVVRGYYDDWRRVCELMLASARRDHSRQREGAALRGLGELDLMQYRLDDAVLRFEQASAAFEAAGDRQGQALVTLGIGGTYVEAGRFDEGLACLEQAKASLGEMGDHRSEVWALRRLGRLHQLQERYAHAAECFQQALATVARIEDPVLEAGVLERLGEIRTLQGRAGDAHPILERALRLHREYGDLFGQARALGSLGELHHSEALPDQALNYLGDSLRLWRQLGLPREQARTLRRLAAVHDGNGNPQAAEAARSEARRLVDELGLPETEELPVLHT
ncbi:MAG: BTAD domain-containing putative transcriptional regulator [Pseudonocardiaceae bacterium]